MTDLYLRGKSLLLLNFNSSSKPCVVNTLERHVHEGLATSAAEN